MYEYKAFTFQIRWSSKSMTSKIDNPPPYEDAIHHPNYGNYPLHPQHGSPVPPPPSYSPSPGMCSSLPSYWGQDGICPQAGMWEAPVLSPTGVPTTVPTLSAGVPASNTGSEDMIERFR